MNAVWDLQGFSPSEKLVLLSLADNANDNGWCWPSAANIVRRTGLSESTVRRVIGTLVKRGIIDQKDRPGRSCYYRVNPYHGDTPVMVKPLSPRQDTPITMTGHPYHGDTQNHHRTIKEPSLLSAPPPAGEKPKSSRAVAKVGFDQNEIPEAWGQYLADYLPDADPGEMFNDFRDHHLKLASRFADWGAAWRNWVRNAAKGLPYVRRSVQRVDETLERITPAQWLKAKEEKRAARAEGRTDDAVQPRLVSGA